MSSKARKRSNGKSKGRVVRLPEGTRAEVKVLRKIVSLALTTFESRGPANLTPEKILKEAAECAIDDIEMLENMHGGKMPFVRAQYRIQLAGALAEYVRQFGDPEINAMRKLLKKKGVPSALEGAA